MKTALVSSLLVLGLCVVGFSQEAPPTADKPLVREKFDPARDPAKDIAAAAVVATKEKKKILLDVGGEWCGWCKLLDEFFIADKEARELLHKTFVVVKVNYSPDNKNEAVLSQYPKIPGYPHFFILDQDGKFVASQGTGDLETGPKHDHDKMMAFLKKWAATQ